MAKRESPRTRRDHREDRGVLEVRLGGDATGSNAVIGDSRDAIEELLARASRAQAEGRLAAAAELFRRALDRRPDFAPAWNALGVVFLGLDRPAEAAAAFGAALRLDPDHPQAAYNLARLDQVGGRPEAAAARYEALLRRHPGYGAAWHNLADILRGQGRVEEALAAARRAVEAAPDLAEAWNLLGVLLDDLDRPAEAAAAYRSALERRPGYVAAHFNLGLSLQRAGRLEEAARHYRAVLAARPGDASARFLLGSLGAADGERAPAAPAEYVRRVFDGCAARFEALLVDRLDYRTPEVLFELVRPFVAPGVRILDLGCGTGLGSERYRPLADLLVGMDLSPGMLAQAARKGTYDRLVEGDILGDWGDVGDAFDLVVCADVLVYVGELGPVVRRVHRALAPGGLWAFSVEALPDEPGAAEAPFRLCPTGRYQHRVAAVEVLCAEAGLRLEAERPATLRLEAGAPVAGWLAVFRRPGGDP
ncbi:tetratricopeptide repeat protein [Dissulfurirhabdus thermomarina]|uniref:Tetratricopeptide repeat protein n=1 Tax=Dissulfurirhabdus thermomarina TaxID=1765737 RepID=A0A6N9TJK6_DISTH|nr:tetratricopeptide repeat protein [Dissulfurirhabdus thermomarina]NDY41441.1 tetratricopeptide repeat protein [Dissulfurirhabdus thermomarina]NMX24277.1 tetratricopeptide repeat protein [Dissulfurirhabdus thermomarina]